MSANPNVVGNARGGRGSNPLDAIGNIVTIFFSIFGIFPRGKVAAILLWLGSVYTTALLFSSVGTSGLRGVGSITGFSIDFLSAPFISAAIAQFILTVAESPFWSRGEKDAVTIGAMCIDVGIVAAAMYPFTKNFGSSTIWYAVTDAFTWIDPNWGGGASIALAILLGIIGAAGPEKLWNTR